MWAGARPGMDVERKYTSFYYWGMPRASPVIMRLQLWGLETESGGLDSVLGHFMTHVADDNIDDGYLGYPDLLFFIFSFLLHFIS